MAFSGFCWRVLGTCLVLAASFGVVAAGTKTVQFEGLAVLFLMGAGLSLVVGLIASIWE